MNIERTHDAEGNYVLLLKNKIIDEKLYKNMKKAMDFRIMSTHEYEKINIKEVEVIINEGLYDLINFAEIILAQTNKIKNFKGTK